MSSARTFVQDLGLGHAIEDRVARWLRQAYTVRLAALGEQLAGFDLVVDLAGGQQLRIEVKSQHKPGDSFFVETKGGTLGSQGWAFTTQADLLALVEASARFVILLRPSALQRELGGFIALYGQALGPVPATGRSRASGCIVPWHELHALGRLLWLSGPPPELGFLLAAGQARTVASEVLDLGPGDPLPEPFDPF